MIRSPLILFPSLEKMPEIAQPDGIPDLPFSLQHKSIPPFRHPNTKSVRKKPAFAKKPVPLRTPLFSALILSESHRPCQRILKDLSKDSCKIVDFPRFYSEYFDVQPYHLHKPCKIPKKIPSNRIDNSLPAGSIMATVDSKGAVDHPVRGVFFVIPRLAGEKSVTECERSG